MAHLSSPFNVVIVGDSQVHWLGRFVSDGEMTRPGTPAGWALDKANCTVCCLGRRGATLRTVRAMGPMIAARSPEIVVIHVSGNDIDCRSGSPPQAVGMAVFCFAKTLIATGVKRVVISQVIRRDSWRHFSREVGNARTACINEFLMAACGGDDNIVFWQHRRLWNSQRPVFRADGIHLSNLGNLRFLRSIRGAIITAAKHVAKSSQ